MSTNTMANDQTRLPPLPRGAPRQLIIAELMARFRRMHRRGSQAAYWAWLEARDEYLNLLAEHERFMARQKQITLRAGIVEPGRVPTVKDYI